MKGGDFFTNHVRPIIREVYSSLSNGILVDEKLASFHQCSLRYSQKWVTIVFSMPSAII